MIPATAATATATPKVIKDIKKILKLNDSSTRMIISTFNRPNIYYEVRYKSNLDQKVASGALFDLMNFIKDQHAKHPQSECSGIVYCHKKSDCGVVADQISRKSGIEAIPYHAGLGDKARLQAQNDWMTGKVKIAVATVAVRRRASEAKRTGCEHEKEERSGEYCCYASFFVSVGSVRRCSFPLSFLSI